MSQESGTLKKEVFYRVVEALEEKISMSAYYTVELACQNMDVKPEDLKQEDLPRLVNEILEIYKEYYPHRVADVGNHLSMRLLQKFDIKPKKRRRGFRAKKKKNKKK
ncbi:MAG: hypothetical protein ACTSVC_06085 [Promethearchaeota archaeon]